MKLYNPNLGRFIQRNPLAEAAGINLYAYCGDTPICGIDPSGLATILPGQFPGDPDPFPTDFPPYNPNAAASSCVDSPPNFGPPDLWNTGPGSNPYDDFLNPPNPFANSNGNGNFMLPSDFNNGRNLSSNEQFWWGALWFSAGAVEMRTGIAVLAIAGPPGWITGSILISISLASMYYGLSNMYAGINPNMSSKQANSILNPYMTPTELLGPETAPETLRPR